MVTERRAAKVAAYLLEPQNWNRYAYVNNSPLNRIDPDGRNWFYLEGHWEWHKGKKFTDSQGHVHRSNYTALLVAQRTGTNAQGAATYRLTLYDQNRQVATGTAFSGGGGNREIKEGNFTIRSDIRDPNGPTQTNPASPDHNPPQFYGIQVIRREPLPDPRTGTLYDVFGAYGPMRARLNPWKGPDPGDYFHGQYNNRGYTHGCLCYGHDTRFIEVIWNLPPQKVPVAVNVPVVEP